MNINRIELEITNICNSKCLYCCRNDADTLNTKNYTVKDIKNIIPKKIIKNVKTVDICGRIGEPTLNPNIQNIIEYIVGINNNILIDVSTNGCTNTKMWWYQFGKCLKDNNITHQVIFSIDGLKDTYSIYRKGLDYNTTINNLKMFIKGGGNAIWQFIIFDHNKNDISRAKKLSMQLKCIEFECVHNDHHYTLPNKYSFFKKIITDSDKLKLYFYDHICSHHSYFLLTIDGYIIPCCYYGVVNRETFQNVKNDTLINILNSKQYYNNAMDLIKNDKCPDNCVYNEYIQKHGCNIKKVLNNYKTDVL